MFVFKRSGGVKSEKDRYIRKLMEKYNVYEQRQLYSIITQQEYEKLIKLQLDAVRGT